MVTTATRCSRFYFHVKLWILSRATPLSVSSLEVTLSSALGTMSQAWPNLGSRGLVLHHPTKWQQYFMESTRGSPGGQSTTPQLFFQKAVLFYVVVVGMQHARIPFPHSKPWKDFMHVEMAEHDVVTWLPCRGHEKWKRLAFLFCRATKLDDCVNWCPCVGASDFVHHYFIQSL